ncbi:MAG: hypothetical protein IT204_16865 [Fimbriimonadaceae bacterium]|nr:hypothetical protein [Fimbriimonadaceae bacterium]
MRRDESYANSELVLGLVAPVGTPLEWLEEILRSALEDHGYALQPVRVSEAIIGSMDLENRADHPDLHDDSVELIEAGTPALDTISSGTPRKVVFRPFVGVGPRRFLDLFSLGLGSGYKLKRQEGGDLLPWTASQHARLRTPLVPYSYLQVDVEATKIMGPLLRSPEEGDTP